MKQSTDQVEGNRRHDLLNVLRLDFISKDTKSLDRSVHRLAAVYVASLQIHQTTLIKTVIYFEGTSALLVYFSINRLVYLSYILSDRAGAWTGSAAEVKLVNAEKPLRGSRQPKSTFSIRHR